MAAMSFDLPPGFRFRPTELEIIEYYLRLKITGNDEKAIAFIREVDFLKWEPWQLPGLSGIEAKDQEWFYFSQPEKKQPNGKQFNRTTNSGFWKVSGHDKEIFSGGRSIGKKKILVFHQGSAANGKRTDWVMHEHRTTLKELDGTKPGQKPYVFCRLFYKPKQNSGKAEDHPITSNECLHPENSDGMECDTTIATGTAKSASESPDKGCKGRKRQYTSKAEPAKSKRSAAAASPSLELLPIDHTPTEKFLLSKISDTIPSAENQVAESMKHVIADEVDLQPEIPLTSLSDAAAVSFPTTAKSSPEEAESDPRQASASGEEGDNQVTGYCPAKNLHETTANTIAFTERNHISDNAEKAQVTDTEFDQQLQEGLYSNCSYF
ncbi:protein NTM1-like 9 [Corylus avellana]|uniref:protein NTM1-like 9 n=1 Tax=Corylus avellana TaxID=13451 RepID=UPI00286B6D97|nr:protein NTM1-like 9 [Corylus avellana]